MNDHIPVRPVRVASPYILHPNRSIGLDTNMDTTTTAATINAGVSRVLLQTFTISHEAISERIANATALFDSLSITSQNARSIVSGATMLRQPPMKNA